MWTWLFPCGVWCLWNGVKGSFDKTGFIVYVLGDCGGRNNLWSIEGCFNMKEEAGVILAHDRGGYLHVTPAVRGSESSRDDSYHGVDKELSPVFNLVEVAGVNFWSWRMRLSPCGNGVWWKRQLW